MVKTCDVCGQELGLFKKFRYADGYICKACYAKASRQFTETIRNKSLLEIKALCYAKRDEESFENFKVTGKIGNYLLVDEKNYRLCLMNNRMTNRKVTDPEFYDVADIESCSIKYQPVMAFEELEQKVKEQRSEETISFLKVELILNNGKKKEISLLEKPVRIKSFAFRQSFYFAKRINDEVQRLMMAQKPVEGVDQVDTV